MGSPGKMPLFRGLEDWRELGRMEGIGVPNSGARCSKLGLFVFNSCSCKLGRGSGLTLAHDVGQLGNGEET